MLLMCHFQRSLEDRSIYLASLCTDWSSRHLDLHMALAQNLCNFFGYWFALLLQCLSVGEMQMEVNPAVEPGVLTPRVLSCLPSREAIDAETALQARIRLSFRIFWMVLFCGLCWMFCLFSVLWCGFVGEGW